MPVKSLEILNQVSNYLKHNLIKIADNENQTADSIDTEQEYFLFHQNRFLYIINILIDNYKEGLKFLDIGSHFHHLTIATKLIGYQVFGTDLAKYVQMTKARAGHFSIDNRVVDLSNDRLPFANSSIDLINFSETLEHLNFHPQQTFNEIFRVLKPAGRLIITTPNLLRLNNRLKMIIGKSIHSDLSEGYYEGIHYREYSSSEIIYLLKQAGWQKIEMQYVNFDYPINPIVKLVGKVISSVMPQLKSNLVVFAKK